MTPDPARLPHHPFAPALEAVAIASLGMGFACAAFVAFDETRRPQRMRIMNLVWPLTMLFGGLIWLMFYWRSGRGEPAGKEREGENGQTAKAKPPMPVAVAKGASHCGAGCTLGDIVAEWLAFGFPAIPLAFGWRSIFGEKMFAVWGLDYIVAFAFGVAFQYFTIAPMRNLPVGKGILAALKADAASITSWQIGMYGAMAAIQLLWFRPVYGRVAEADTPEFWLAMQIAMICGFGTAFPVNWVLVKTGVKERM